MADAFQLHLDLLGPFEARFSTGPTAEIKLKAARLLLAWLALRPKQSGSREEIAALLWSERSDAQAHQSLRQTLTVLRRTLGDRTGQVLRVDRERVALVPGVTQSDAAHMVSLGPESGLEALERAVAQYRGEFLDGLSVRDPLVQQWLDDRRSELRSAAIERFGWLLSAHELGARHGDVLRVATRLIDVDPLAEEGYRALIRAHLALGDRAMALRQFRRCRDVLARNLSVEPAEETKALLRLASEPQRKIAAGLPLLVKAGRAQQMHNLPRQISSLVGREETVGEVAARIETYRLVTLTGAGGSGKTRMAIEIGLRLDGAYADGVWLVELASISDPRLVGEALCGVLGVPVVGDRPALTSAIAYLQQRQALLILDNCEHVISEVARLAETILSACPGVSILATSREGLAVAGEGLYRVPRLSYPEDAADTSVAAIRHYSAVQLFVERAVATVEHFKLDETTAPAIASICRQVEGMPLAIELAVGRLKMMQLDRLAADLGSSFLTLRRSARTGLKHHETLRAMHDWSYDLLQPDEQAFLRRISVFAGGCSLAAAIEVASGAPIADDSVFDLLTSLVEKSLLSVDLSEAEPRYRLLETTRQYAWHKQQEHLEPGRQHALAHYLVSRLTEAWRSWASTPTDIWLGRYEPELDNLRATLEWAFGEQGDPVLGTELASLSIRLWDELSLFREKGRWVELATVEVRDKTPPAIAARLHLARTTNSAHGDQSGFPHASRAVQLLEPGGRTVELGEALARSGATLLTLNTTAEALPYLDSALKTLEPFGPTKQLASCLRSKGVAAYLGGAVDVAQAMIERSMAVCRSVGDARGLASASIALAEMDFVAGRIDDAIYGIMQMLESTGYNHRQATLGLSNLAAYHLVTDNIEDARDAAGESLHLAVSLGWPGAIVRASEHIALVAASTGQAELAGRLAGFAEAFYARGVASRELTEQSTYTQLTARLEKQFSQTRLSRLSAEGAAWTEAEAVRAAGSIAAIVRPVRMAR